MEPQEKNQKPQNIIKSVRRILTYFKPFKIQLILVAIGGVIATVSAIFGPKILGDMVSAVSANFEMTASGIRFTPDLGEIARLGLLLVAIYLVSGAFGYLQNFIMAGVTQKITFKMRKELSQKIATLPMGYFDKRKTGDIVSIITNDIEKISESLSQSINTILYSSISLIGVTAMMFSISWQITLIALGSAVISVFLIVIIARSSQSFFSDLQKSTGKINAHTEEMLSSHEIIKAYNGEAGSVRKFNQINSEMYSAAWKSQLFGGLTYPVMNFIGNLSSLSTAILGGIRVIQGDLSLGNLSSLITYVSQFNRPISEVASSMTVVQSTLAASKRVFDFLDAEEESHIEKYLTLPKDVRGAVKFSKVNFSYSKNKPIITDFSADILAGSTVAIVGPTGAGKTTLVNLLMRFYDIDSGKITIDGVDTSKLHRKDVRSLFGMVLQDTWLFNGTIAENLSYGKKDATREEIVEAAKAAHADHFIRTLPKGYDTMISEDVDNVSAGEKQLLTIARANLPNLPMLILDEATSSVDTRTEAAIQSAMDNLTNGRTSFVIAHRLSTIKNADLILVMEQGNIVEQGNHEDLLAKNGAYAKLYNSQFAE
ncbi:MAG: ABC transporter ATP-binding protein [bacterium]|nr:ABC transporter ATP-binding protein [bacterium]